MIYWMKQTGLVQAAAAEWPTRRWPYWVQYRDQHSLKLASRCGIEQLPMSCQLLLHLMAQMTVDRPDDCFPDLSLHGGGLHELPPGGYLNQHCDATHHPNYGWSRAASMVLFLDRWQENWGGELTYAGQQVTPEPGKVVVLDSCEPHAVRQVTGPHPRRTLALFWWCQRNLHDQVREKAEFL